MTVLVATVLFGDRPYPWPLPLKGEGNYADRPRAVTGQIASRVSPRTTWNAS
jgi:hypothetical protein